MRLFACILSFHILFLALEPGVKAICFAEYKTECCGGSCKSVSEEKSQTEKQPVKKDAGNQTACNPFATCNACSGYTLALIFSSLSPEVFLINQHTPVTENFPSKIAIDFWQPPKIS
jgi:hypothetical protein